MKKIMILLIFSLLFNCINKYNKDTQALSEVEKIDTILYSYEHHHGFLKLMLFSNSKFKFVNQLHPELGYSKITGSYSKSNNTLKLKPLLTLECKSFENNKFIKPICDTIEFAQLEHQVKTNYFSFNWQNNNYLLSEEPDQIYDPENDENDFHRFINNYNSGYEPKKHNRYLISKAKTEINNELPIDSFPKKYRHLISKKTIH